ncbi:MAG: NDP-sugar synthase [Actinobacteria bacterium]|nr:NDP-sugar synthase [Actinomycetota bacterium]
MKGAMLVGGFGTRLQPLTVTTPKPMLPLVNTPFLEIELLHLKEYGVDDVVLSTGYLPAVFDEYFGDGSRMGIKLTHVTEDKPLGTCGAIKNVAGQLGDGPVIVCNGDILTDLDIGELVDYHQRKGAVVTITLTPVEDPTAYGLVPLDEDGRISEFLEKPSWDQVVTNLINAGTYVLDPAVLDQVPGGENYSFERQLFPDLLKQGEPLYGFPSDCYWLDLGTPRKYISAHHDILGGKIKVPLGGKEIREKVFVGRDVEIGRDAGLNGPLLVGDRVSIGAGAEIGGLTCIGNGVRVGPGARVEGSVILDDAVIGERCVVEQSVVGRGTVLSPGVHVAEYSVLGDNIEAGEENEFRRGIRVWPSTVIEAGKIKF